KFHTNSTPQHNQSVENHKKDYKGKYKGHKAEISILSKKIDVSSEDEGTTIVKAFMAIVEDEPSVGKVAAR
ncbi:hypothetical protein Tco_0225802, partial [Tanacetum coccineum]